MPTYEYVCTACQNQWEEIQKISDQAIEVCPKCGQSTAKRQISGGNFILKGGGWYADLYSSTSNKKSGEGSSSSSSSTTSTSSTKSDTSSASTSSASSAPSSSSSSASSGSAAGSK